MDTLYIGDIPNTYKYAVFNNNYIDLYNEPILHNNTYDYYRIYTNYDYFLYSKNSATYSNYQTQYTTELKITDNPCYRKDFAQICIILFIIVFFAIFLLNIITSSVKRGGVLGGLI